VAGFDRWSIEAIGSPLAVRVDFHEEIGSTQERARELARAGAQHGTLVISKVQKGGRGRLGRAWGSPPGGLWMSLLLRPDLPARFAPRVTQAAAVGVAKALWGFGVEARIKWPNDLLVDGRKVCGILAESSAGKAPAGRPDFVVLGVGLNANLDPADLDVAGREVATVRSVLGHDADLVELLRAILSNLGFELGRIQGFAAILDDWRALNCTLGNLVRLERFGKVLEGRAADLTPEGALLLETPGGKVEVFEGEVEHMRQESR
jgi:BirA family transcriptional regulator, biotin operon repressor / biotin---[acetyl-CoA-carboxylase] ligase